MTARPTLKAGIPKTLAMADPRTRLILDQITERVEVIDGLRGDKLDRAVTFRDLEASGFSVDVSGNAVPINNVPTTPTTGPEVGPAAKPENLAAAETFLALLLTWDNPSFNLQHIEVWRGTTDNLSLAVKIGTTVAPTYVDYVGADSTYYYWVRAVGTDGTFSAYNDTAGTEGVTGIDPGSLTIDPRFFVLEDGTGSELPFLTDGAGTIGIDGDLIVDGTIRAESIVANSIGADQIAAIQISAISADLGEMTAGLFRTADNPAYRVEIEDQASTAYPLWYGSGAKSAPNGLFYVDASGQVVVNGLLNAGMIKQSYFVPAGDDDSFRIAVEYPSEYAAGTYSGKRAHLFPMKTANFASTERRGERIAPKSTYGGFLHSPFIKFAGPMKASSEEYGRIGTYSEIFMINFAASAVRFDSGDATAITMCFATLEYQYDTEGWFDAFKGTVPPDGAFSGFQTFVSREDPWDDLSFRVRVEVSVTEEGKKWGVHGISLGAWTPNFGYGDATAVLQPPDDDTPIEDLPDYPQYDGNPLP